MAKVTKKTKKEENKNSEKYNADNEIIIGVTTKPKEKVRVEKKSARTNNKKKQSVNSKKQYSKNASKNNSKKKKKSNNKRIIDTEIKKINKKKILISTIVLILLVLCGMIYYLTTPVFNVSNVIIYGNEKNSADTYISLSEITINETNIFGFTKSGIEHKLKDNAYVEKVEIKRKLPNIIELYITERKVDYQIKHLNGYIYLNNQGYILEMNEEKKEVPIIEGISIRENDIQVGKRLSNEELLKLDTILKIVNYIKYNNVESKITSINVTDILNYILNFEEEGKIAYLGDSSSITEKMTLVANILKAEKGKKGIIHATENELKRNRVYFTELEEE